MTRRTVHEPEDDAHGDEGFSLIETVVAVALLGISVASIMGGLFSATRVSRIGNDKAKVEAVLSSAVDRLTGWAYLPCPAQDTSGGYLPVVQAASGAVKWPASTVSIVDVAYWNPTGPGTGTWSASNALGGTECNQAVGLTTSRTLQKVTIRVSAPDGLNARQIEVVKSDVFPRAEV
jgi:prepilin-type N-terminal cleavage/methylation domain-containing protein